MGDRLAIIMAGGRNTRMVSDTPKMLHTVCGASMLEHVLRALDPVCAKPILVVSEANHHRVMNAIGDRADFVVQDSNGYGTGYAAKCAARKLEGRGGWVIVTASDIPLVQPETYAKLAAEVESGHRAAMLTVVTDEPFGYGRIIRDESGGSVLAIVEQKDLTEDQRGIREINASVFCFDIESLLWALPQLTVQNRANEFYLTDVIPLFVSSGRSVVAVQAADGAEGMGVNERAQLAQVERAMRGRINDNHMRAGVTMTDPENTYIEVDVEIGPDTIIRPGCRIGRGCKIGGGVSLSNVTLENVSVGNGAKLEYVVARGVEIAQGAEVGPFVRL